MLYMCIFYRCMFSLSLSLLSSPSLSPPPPPSLPTSHTHTALLQMRGEIDNANDSLIAFNTLNGQLQRTKKQYIQGVEHVARAQEKLNKGLADPTINAKTKQHVS